MGPVEWINFILKCWGFVFLSLHVIPLGIFCLPPLRLEKNVKRELSFSPAAARVAGEPKGLKGGKPASSNEIALWETQHFAQKFAK